MRIGARETREVCVAANRFEGTMTSQEMPMCTKPSPAGRTEESHRRQGSSPCSLWIPWPTRATRARSSLASPGAVPFVDQQNGLRGGLRACRRGKQNTRTQHNHDCRAPNSVSVSLEGWVIPATATAVYSRPRYERSCGSHITWTHEHLSTCGLWSLGLNRSMDFSSSQNRRWVL